MTLAQRAPASSPGRDPEREFAFEPADFRQIASMLYADSGICLAEQKETLVYARLVKRLRALGLQSFKDYCRLLASEDGVPERQQMLTSLTTNVTAFFREKHHFDYLRTNELPKLLQSARNGGRVRIWSAGCSKGHEPYSIAMTVLSVMPNAADHDVRILATDIDSNVVATGREGVYDADDLADVPQADRERFFEPAGGRHLATGDSLRRLVAFRELNLMGAWPMRGAFDVIFCRNVTIYFDAQTQAALWTRFADALRPGGLLCIGHSERLSGTAQNRFTTTGTTMYRLQGGGRTA